MNAEGPGFPPLVISTDPEKVRKRLGPLLVLYPALAVVVAVLAVVTAAVTAANSGVGSGVLSAIPMLVGLALLMYLTVYVTRTVAVRSSPGVVLVLDASGLHATLSEGDLTVPWDRVVAVSVRRTGLLYRLASDTTPQSPGVSSTLPDRYYRLLLRRGFGVGTARVDVPPRPCSTPQRPSRTDASSPCDQQPPPRR